MVSEISNCKHHKKVHIFFRFLVVEFVKDKSTYVVPTTWIFQDGESSYTFWPPVKTKLDAIKMMTSHKPVGTNWTLLEIKILGSRGKISFLRTAVIMLSVIFLYYRYAEGSTRQTD